MSSIILAVGWPISFDQPQWLWLLLTIPVIVAVSVRSLAGLDRTRRATAVFLRCLLVAVLAAVLARIEIVKRNDHVAVMFVIDRSRSIPDDLRETSQQYVREVAKRAGGDDRLGIIGFDGLAEVDLITSRGGLDVMNFGMAAEPDRSNIAAGLRVAMASFPDGYARRVVVLSDGNENLGDLSAEIEVAAASNVSIDVVPLQYQHRDEILFDRIVVPSHAGRDTRIPLRLIAKSRKRTRAKLSLFHNDTEVPLADPILSLQGGMKPNRFTIPIELFTGGVHRFDARLTPLDPDDDAIVENNSATAFTFVGEQGRVLILTQPNVEDDVPLYNALKREKIDVEMRGVDQVQIDLLKLQEYGVVILANVSADLFTSEQQKALASFVRDFGGGLVMVGGDESFGAGGWIGTPIEEISPVSFEIKHKKIIPRGALAIIMHSCEIPKGNYWGEQVASAAVDTISSLDYLGVICYSYRVNGPNWDVPLAPATDKAAIKRKIKQMQIGDMPDFDSTMRNAVNALMGKQDAAQRHMIIISDGDPSPPSNATIKRMTDNGITCSTVGIGYGSHVMEGPLRKIAKQTGGRFYGVKNPRRLPQIFVKESKVVRRSLIDERLFHPQLVFNFAETTEGIAVGELPALGGLVLTQPKGESIMPIVRSGSDGQDPVLAHWNYEMGKMAVFTSGLWPKWGSRWVGWEKFGKFWAQLVRWVARQEASADFDVLTRLEGNTGHVVVEALKKDAGYLNFLRIDGRLLTPSMEQKKLYLTQTGPGRYEASFDINDHGNYLISLQYGSPDGQSGMIRTGLSMPYSPEFREMQTNFALLEQAVERTGGRWLERMNPETDDVFSRNLPPVVSRQPVWRATLLWVFLPLFLLDVAGRRLASVLAMSVYVEIAVFIVACAAMYAARAPFFGYVGALVLAELVGWTIRYRYILPTIQFFTHGAASMARVGQRSATSLSQLKGVRQKTREKIKDQAAEPTSADTTPLEPAADRTRRFDAGDEVAQKPAKDLTQTLGSAAASKIDESPETKRHKQQDKAGQAGDLASRLLKAKKRAKDRIDEHHKNE